MDCQRCGAEMKLTTAFRLPTENLLEMQPARECIQCGMLFADGKWVDMRSEPQAVFDEDGTCPLCFGSGKYDLDSELPCPHCSGKGRL